METKKWNEVKSDVFKFENIGDQITGEYIAREISALYDNDVYQIRTESGIFAVFGTAVLSSKMAKVPLNSEVRIVYSGTEKNKKAGQSDIKLFDVFYR